MRTTHLTLNTPNDFAFLRTVYSHGWCTLAPFKVDKEHQALNRLFMLPGNSPVFCKITSAGISHLRINVTYSKGLTALQKSDILHQTAVCLRLMEDYSNFYNEIRHYPKYRWIVKLKAGRMLRAPTVFEDVVKMICTTNCNWSLTETIIENLVGELGNPFNDSLKCFPTPEALAGTTEQFLRKTIRAGYRSPFLLDFAEKVASQKLDVEQWRSPKLQIDSLYRDILSIKGVGAYAAGNILKLLGYYDYLGLDSWSRGEYYRIYHKGRTVSDRTIERRYEQYGKWRGLLFWLEMTKHWYNHKSPF